MPLLVQRQSFRSRGSLWRGNDAEGFSSNAKVELLEADAGNDGFLAWSLRPSSKMAPWGPGARYGRDHRWWAASSGTLTWRGPPSCD